MIEPIRPIRPELLAAKMEKIGNFEYPDLLEEFGNEPRLIRVLWFLQYVSQPANYAGGLSKFAEDLIASNAERIGTAHMLKLGSAKKYRACDIAEIQRDLPYVAWHELVGSENCYLSEDDFAVEGRVTEKRLGSIATPEKLKSFCVTKAKENLAEYLKEVCELPHIGLRAVDKEMHGRGAPWYFVAIADVLLLMIEDRAQAIRGRIATTEITQLITRWVAKSRNTQRPVMIIGNSRFGKTEAVRTEAAADPGYSRLVNTPATNAMGDLLREVAKALGMELGPINSGQDLRERIDYILRHSRLQLIFDESQLLLPSAYSRSTAPARLNWVRRSIMDQEIAAVFVCTPQSYLPAKRRFVKVTGFAMEQFDERILKTVQLPERLGESDLLAVAKIHFSNLGEDYLGYVVDLVIATERNFVSDIEKIATLAKDNAREHGRRQPTIADIKLAIQDVLPPSSSAIDPAAETTRATAGKRPDKRSLRQPRNIRAQHLQSRRRGLETLDRDRFQRPMEAVA